MVTREMIQTEINRWKRLRKDARGELHDHIRSYLEEQIPPSERRITRGNAEVDAIDYALEDLGSYG